MTKLSKWKFILLACLALSLFATACEDTKKIEEANKSVDAANKKSDEAKALMSKTADSLINVTKDMTDLAETKSEREGEIKELVKNYDKVMELQKGAAADFNQAAKLNPNEKFKAYYEMSAKDMEKTAEVVGQSKEMAKALLDSEDIEAYNAKLQGVQTRSAALTKESDDLRAKLSKLEGEVKALNK
jgi:uncharacterized coiled-coil DUF342 family protein